MINKRPVFTIKPQARETNTSPRPIHVESPSYPMLNFNHAQNKTKKPGSYNQLTSCQLIGILIAFSLLVPRISDGAEDKGPTSYHITANQVIYNGKLNYTTYIGNFHVQQGSSEAFGDKLIFYYQPNTTHITKVIAIGHPARYETMLSNHKQLKAKAKIIQYLPEKDQILLFEEAEVTQNNHVLKSPVILYDRKNDTLLSTHWQQQGKTTVIIPPQKTKENNTLSKP